MRAAVGSRCAVGYSARVGTSKSDRSLGCSFGGSFARSCKSPVHFAVSFPTFAASTPLRPSAPAQASGKGGKEEKGAGSISITNLPDTGLLARFGQFAKSGLFAACARETNKTCVVWQLHIHSRLHEKRCTLRALYLTCRDIRTYSHMDISKQTTRHNRWVFVSAWLLFH